MYKMGCSRLECKWQEMIEETKHFRIGSVALVISDDLVDCADNEELFGLGIAIAVISGMILIAYITFALNRYNPWPPRKLVTKL